MADTKKVKVTAAELKASQNSWVEFTKLTKIGVLSIIVLMALLAIFVA